MWKRRHSFYRQNGRKIRKNFIFASFVIFSFFSLSLGIGLCLLKSPESKSDYYLSLSSYYRAQLTDKDVALQGDAQNYLLQGAKEAALKSIYHTPYKAKAWQQLSSLLHYSQDTEKALKALEITKILGSADMPALLPSRDFVLSNAVSQLPENQIILR